MHIGCGFQTISLHKYLVYTARPLIYFTLAGAIMSQPAEAVSSEITQLSHYINGEHIAGTSGRFGDIFNPSKGVKIIHVRTLSGIFRNPDHIKRTNMTTTTPITIAYR